MQSDPVGDLETARLAQVLHEAHDVTGQTPPSQLVVEGQVQRNHLAALPRDSETLLGPDPQRHVVRCELNHLSVEEDRHRLSRLERIRRCHTVERSQRRLEALSPLAEPGAEGAEIGHELEREDLTQLVRRIDLVDVEFVRHDVAQDRRCARRQKHQGAPQGLAHFHRGLAAGSPPK